MAELLGCRNCGAAWSAPNNPFPALLRFMWCKDCGGQSFIPIGEVYGISRPPVHIGTSPPAATRRTPLLLTNGPAAVPGGAPAPPPGAPAAVPPAQPRVAPTKVLPSDAKPIVLGASEQLLKDMFLNHVEGEVLSFPPNSLISKYFPNSADAHELKKGEMKDDSKAYARLIAIYLVEKHNASLRIQIAAPKGDTYKGVPDLNRNLLSTLTRIAKGESIAKGLDNQAYNHDGGLTSDKVDYDRYSKNYKGSRPNSKYLPAPSTSARYWEYYVDRDNTPQASKLSMGGGRPGIERLFLGPPDYVYYTWNHYGSDVAFGADRSALTDGDIWAVYSISQRRWLRGLTR